MKRVCGIWVPDEDKHLEGAFPLCPKLGGVPLFQARNLFGILSQTPGWRTAVDVGAHVGTYSMVFAQLFRNVVSFEPALAHAMCFRENLAGFDNVVLHRKAVGAACGPVRFVENHEVSMKSHVSPVKNEACTAVDMVTIDSMGLADVDLIKVDAEGFDAEVIKGAAKTIRANRPAVIVEQARGVSQARYRIEDKQAVHLLQKMGYVVVMHVSNDFVMRHGGD